MVSAIELLSCWVLCISQVSFRCGVRVKSALCMTPIFDADYSHTYTYTHDMKNKIRYYFNAIFKKGNFQKIYLCICTKCTAVGTPLITQAIVGLFRLS